MSEENTNITHDELVNSLTDMIDDNLIVGEAKPADAIPAEVNEANKKSTTEETKETEEASEEDYLADVDEETEEDDDTPEAEADTEEADAEDEGTNEVLFQIDGKDITKEEAEKGYLRQADYTKKTQQLAEEKKALEEEGKTLDYLKAHREFQPKMFELETLQKNIAIAEKAIHFGRTEDGTVLTKELLAETKENVDNAKRELSYETAELNKKMAEYTPPKLDVLQEKVPGLFSKDDAARSSVLENFTVALKDVGFSQAEISAVNDPRLLLLVKEVLDGRELAAKVEKAKARRGKSKGVVSKSTKASSGKARTGKSTGKATDSQGNGKSAAELAKQFNEGNVDALTDLLGDY